MRHILGITVANHGRAPGPERSQRTSAREGTPARNKAPQPTVVGGGRQRRQVNGAIGSFRAGEKNLRIPCQ
jgi:hypothetical protein